MSVMDWESFLRERGMTYRSTGKNVKREHINIPCPFCGPADPSEHMGLELSTGAWGCWRDKNHRGRKPQRLIVALLRCTWDEADQLVEGFIEDVGIEELIKRAKALGTKVRNHITELTAIKFLSNMKKIKREGTTSAAYRYLQKRGWEHPTDVATLSRRYRLRYAPYGDFGCRLIIPFLIEKKIVGWTGRAIGKAELRYVSHPSSEVVKRLLFNYDAAADGGETLLVVEGPLDTLKMDFVGWRKQVRAVGLLGTGYTQPQINMLFDLGRRFERVVVLLDADAEAVAMSLQTELSLLGAEIAFLPNGIKDPGEFTLREASRFIRQFRPS